MPLIGSYVDTFSGTLDAGWTVAGAAIVGGALAVNASQNAGAAVYSSARRAGYTLANSAVLLEVTAVPGVVGNQANAQIWVLDPTPTNTVDRLGFEYRAAAGELDMVGQTGAAYAAIGTTVTVTYNATTMRWLRLRHTGTTIVWETSPDGTTWTVRRTLAQAQVPAWALETDTLTLSIEAYRTTGTNDTFRVDNLNSPPVVAPPAEPTGTLQQPVTVVRRNLCPNPALANDATGWSVRYFSGSTVTVGRAAVSGMSKPWAYRGTGTGANQANLTCAPSLTPVTPGARCSATIEARFSVVPSSPFLVFMWFDSVGTWTRYTANNIVGVTAGAVVQPSATALVPADVVYVAVAVGWLFDGNIVVDATAARVEQTSDSLISYADGGTAGWAWSGTAGSSPSSMTYTIPPRRRNLCTNPTLALDAEGWHSGNTLEGARVAVADLDRPWAWQVVQTAPGTTLARSARTSVTPGQRYSFTVQWRYSAIPDGSAQFTVFYADANGANLVAETKIITPSVTAGAPGRTSMAATAPAGAATAYVQVAAVTTTAPVTVQMTALRVEAVDDESMPYGDGDSYGWAWDTTPGTSTSSTGPDRPRRSPRALTAVPRSYTF